MNTSRLTLSLITGAIAAGGFAAQAHADSVAYIKGGNVYLSTPDGTRQFQVTSGGGYDNVSQADDGTLLATTTADSHLRRLDRFGNVLSDIATPVSDHSGGAFTFQGPFDADISPDGRNAAYGYIETGLFQDPTTGQMYADTKNGAGFTSSSVEKGFTDDGYKHSNDWDAPEWVDNQNVIVSNGPNDPYDDPIAVEKVGSGDPVNWFSDPNVQHPMEATISRNKLILAAVNGPDRSQMVVYHDTNGQLGTTAGAQLNVESCFTYSGSGISTPTFNADGTRGFWATSDGIVTAPFNMSSAGCGTAQNSTTIAPGGSSPDWGPADVPTGRPAAPSAGGSGATGGSSSSGGSASNPGSSGGSTTVTKPIGGDDHPPKGSGVSPHSGTLTVTVTRSRLAKALRSGLVLTLNGTGRAKATARLGHSVVATGSGKGTRLTLRFSAKARRQLAGRRSVTLTISVTENGATQTTRATLSR